MEEKNELGDIILNKSNKSGGNKKLVLAAATLGIILIVVVLLMNTLNSGNQDNLPQSALPPKPATQTPQQDAPKEEPLFEDVEVIDEQSDSEDRKLEKIAQELKEQSATQEPQVEEVVETEVEVAPQRVTTPKKPVYEKRATTKSVHTAPRERKKPAARKARYYIQVGSFSKYRPNKKFLDSITKAGYDYTFHKATVRGKSVTKVLVGPFGSEREARRALANVRKHIEKGAFLTKL